MPVPLFAALAALRETNFTAEHAENAEKTFRLKCLKPRSLVFDFISLIPSIPFIPVNKAFASLRVLGAFA